MMVCIQCAMEAMLKGERYEPTDEEPEAHQRRVHPDLDATRTRRQELVRLLQEHGRS
jgi:hypothetical protein